MIKLKAITINKFTCLLFVLLLLQPSSAEIIGDLKGDVTIAQGKASWGMPLDLPAGPNGIKPGVTLNYDQGITGGLLGVGFSVTGFDSITRCPQTKKHDGLPFNDKLRLNNNDRYCISGERLIVIDGAYGASLSEYRKVNDDQTKIVSMGQGATGYAPKSWTVYTKDGYIYKYGLSESAKVRSNKNGVVLAWHLEEITDRFNNAVRFSYDASQAIVKLTTITWSQYTLEFGYEKRPDTYKNWSDGDEVNLTERLNKITLNVYQADTNTNEAIREYGIEYEMVGSPVRSRIASIQMCMGESNCTRKTTFTWAQKEKPANSSNIPSATSVSVDLDLDGMNSTCVLRNHVIYCNGVAVTESLSDASLPSDVTTASVKFIDINNDLLPDYCIDGDDKVICGINKNGKEFYDYKVWNTETTAEQAYELIDLNNDDYIDLCIFSQKMAFECYLNNKNDAFEEKLQLSNLMVGPVNGDLGWMDKVRPLFVDINNDNFMDICGFDAAGLSCYVNTSTVSSEREYVPTFSAKTTLLNKADDMLMDEDVAVGRLTDLNSDGYVDVCYVVKPSLDIMCAYSRGRYGFTEAKVFLEGSHVDALIGNYVSFLDENSKDGYDAAKLLSAALQFNDLNGDGRSDLIIMGQYRAFDALGNDDDRVNFIKEEREKFWTDDYGAYINLDGNFSAVYAKSDIDAVKELEAEELIQITSGFGEIDRINYKNYDFKATVKRGSTSREIGMRDQRLVESVRSSSQTNNVSNSIYYNYDGYLIDFNNDYSGFAKISTFNRNLQSLNDAYYEQSNTNLLGYVTRTNAIYLPTAKSVDSFPAHSVLSQRFYRLSETQSHYTADFNAIDDRIVSVLPLKTIESDYTKNNEIAVNVTTDYLEYDDYNNPRKVITEKTSELTSEVSRVTTETDYFNDNNKWFIGKAENIKVTHSNSESPKDIIKTTAFTYYADSGALQTKTIEPNNQNRLVSSYEYDAYGNKHKVTQTAANGEQRSSTTHYTQDGLYIKSNKNSLNHEESYTYDHFCGVKKTHLNINNQLTEWFYDSRTCELTKEVRPDGTSTAWSTEYINYDLSLDTVTAASVYKKITSTTGAAPTVTWHDSAGRILRNQTTGLNGEVVYQDTIYDHKGAVSYATPPYFEGEDSIEDDEKIFATNDYKGRVTSTHKPSEDGYVTELIDYDGLTITTYDGENRKRVKLTNLSGKTIKIIENGGKSVLTYNYDAVGNLIESNTNGHIISVHYDSMGNKDYMIDPDMGRWEYTYTGFGELETQTDAKSQTIEYKYDDLGRKIRAISPDGTAIWTYDTAANGVGKIAQESSADGQTISNYEYNSDGKIYRVIKSIAGETHTTRYEYDDAGRIYKTIHPTGFEEIRTYTLSGHLKHIKTKKSSVEDYDTAEYEKSLAALTDKLTELEQLINDETDEYMSQLIRLEELELTAKLWKETAQDYALGSAHNLELLQAADQLLDEAAKLKVDAIASKSNAERYRELEQKVRAQIEAYNDVNLGGDNYIGPEISTAERYLSLANDYQQKYELKMKQADQKQQEATTAREQAIVDTQATAAIDPIEQLKNQASLAHRIESIQNDLVATNNTFNQRAESYNDEIISLTVAYEASQSGAQATIGGRDFIVELQQQSDLIAQLQNKIAMVEQTAERYYGLNFFNTDQYLTFADQIQSAKNELSIETANLTALEAQSNLQSIYDTERQQAIATDVDVLINEMTTRQLARAERLSAIYSPMSTASNAEGYYERSNIKALATHIELTQHTFPVIKTYVPLIIQSWQTDEQVESAYIDRIDRILSRDDTDGVSFAFRLKFISKFQLDYLNKPVLSESRSNEVNAIVEAAIGDLEETRSQLLHQRSLLEVFLSYDPNSVVERINELKVELAHLTAENKAYNFETELYIGQLTQLSSNPLLNDELIGNYRTARNEYSSAQRSVDPQKELIIQSRYDSIVRLNGQIVTAEASLDDIKPLILSVTEAYDNNLALLRYGLEQAEISLASNCAVNGSIACEENKNSIEHHEQEIERIKGEKEVEVGDLEIQRDFYQQKVDDYIANIETEHERIELGLTYREELKEKREAYTTLQAQINANLAEMEMDADHVLLWAATSANASGHITSELTGNGIITQRKYDGASGHLKNITTGLGDDNLIRDLTYRYSKVDNVDSVTDRINGYTNTYSYTLADRIESFTHTKTTGHTNQILYDYDLNGNLKLKSNVGTMAVASGTNRIESLSRDDNSQKTYEYDDNGNIEKIIDDRDNTTREIEWNSINKPILIKGDKASSAFIYDANNKRSQQIGIVTANASTNSDGETLNTEYISSAYERVKTTAGLHTGRVEHKYFVSLNGRVVAVHTETTVNNLIQPTQTRYLHADALGSVDTITDSHANVVQRMRYDPFGKREVLLDNSGASQSAINRGFTGHEQLFGLDLVHMNARIYDSEIGRFLSADIFIQKLETADSYNRYAYVLNNPLKYTDPSGHNIFNVLGNLAQSIFEGIAKILNQVFEFIVPIVTIVVAVTLSNILVGPAWLIGAISGGVSSFVGAIVSGASLSDAFKAGLWGAFIGAGSGFIGHGLGGGGSAGAFGNGVARHLAHATFQGVVSELRGGTFKAGFASGIVGAFSAGMGRVLAPIAKALQIGRKAFMVTLNAVMGGLASVAAGGSFADGAVMAAFRWLFNDAQKQFSQLAKYKARYRQKIAGLLKSTLEKIPTADYATLIVGSRGFYYEFNLDRHGNIYEGAGYSFGLRSTSPINITLSVGDVVGLSYSSDNYFNNINDFLSGTEVNLSADVYLVNFSTAYAPFSDSSNFAFEPGVGLALVGPSASIDYSFLRE